MCLQDLQLRRAELIQSKTVSIGAGGTVEVLPASESRVGFFIAGPSAGTARVLAFGTDDWWSLGNVVNAGTMNTRYFDIYQYGSFVCRPISIFNLTACVVGVVSYELPMDRDQLQRLANQGKF